MAVHGNRPKGLAREVRDVIAYARKFNDEVTRPLVLELDRKMFDDPDYLPWDFIKKANEWGLYTMWRPKAVGGKGLGFPSISPFLEEIASVCMSMANLIGVHYLGVGTLSASFNMRLLNTVYKETVEGYRTGKPCILSLAITEPGAGTDVEERELADKGNITCHTKRVEGGYVLSGSKIFISNGHLSTWHMVFAYTDLKKPSETTVMVAVKTGSKVFSFGRQEKKMGQKVCPAIDVTLSNVSGQLIGKEGHGSDYFTRVSDRMHTAAAAISFGIMKGSYKEAYDYSRKREQGGREIIQWSEVKTILANMAIKIKIAEMTLKQAGHAVDNTVDGWRECSLAAGIYISEMACDVITDGIQVLGGIGYMEDYGQAKRYRDAKQAQSLMGIAPMKKLRYLEKG